MILRLIGFLLVYGLWAWLAFKLNRANEKEVGGLGFLKALLLNSLLIGFGVAVFPALHAGAFNLKLVLTFLLLSQSSLLLTVLLRWFVDLNDTVIMACSRWVGIDLSLSSRGSLILVWTLALISIVGYPIAVVATILRPPPDPNMFALKLGVTAFGLIALPMTAWVFIKVVSHPFWKETARTQLFLTFSSGFVQLFAFVVLAMWAFGLTSTGATMNVVGVPVHYSPKLLWITFLSMICVYFLPLVRGVMWGSRARRYQLEERLTILGRTIGILRAPAAATMVDRLQAFTKDLTEAVEAHEQADPVRRLAKNLENPDFKPRKLKIARESFFIARNFDMRFDQSDWVKSVLPSLGWAIQDLSSKPDPEHRLAAAERWAALYEGEEGRVRRDVEASAGSKTPLYLFLGFLLSPILSTFLSKCGDVLWDLLAKALG